MLRIFIILPLMYLASGCPSESIASEVNPTLLSYQLDGYYPGLCDRADGLGSCADKIEARALRDHPDSAFRKGAVLTLKTQQNKIQTFTDGPLLKYAFAESAFGMHVVLEIVEEGWNALLVPQSNRRPEIVPGLPLFSEDGLNFALASLDLDAGFRPNIVQIWKRDNGSYKKQYELTDFPLDGGPFQISWLPDNTLEVKLLTLDQMYNNNSIPSAFLHVTSTTQGWKEKQSWQPLNR
jgi:hypothetical protein